jgi:hypothetical protein
MNAELKKMEQQATIVGKIPSDAPQLIMFLPSGPVPIPTFAYRVSGNTVQFIAYDGVTGIPQENVDSFLGSAIIKQSRGDSYNVAEIEARFKAKGVLEIAS